jgi:hypothetical protein
MQGIQFMLKNVKDINPDFYSASQPKAFSI